ncbi:MAG TPA: aconitate hydratase AcnA [Rhodocyclaceae bacterium]|nr:aconitate hydratase AcnA [Rhodocyclaceae bacterium]
MENPDTTYTREAVWNGNRIRMVDLPGLTGARCRDFPVVLRLLLENVARNMRGDERDSALVALKSWLRTGSSEAEIAFQPGRVLMHDTTSTPALVDIAAMRDALAEAGSDPAILSPVLPVDVSIDHSLAVEAYGQPGAEMDNMQHEIRRNAERYRFLRWASGALGRVHIHPPGTGIMHTLHLEQLAKVVTKVDHHGAVWVVPDMMLGTDSHTPMVNGIGVLGWGVGGLEAQVVMFGMPTTLRIPDVIGVRLTGALRNGVQATDLALVVTQRLRALGVAGEFVEYFGPGVSTLTAGDRTVIANMAPEYGATTGFFAVDAQTLRYLRATGRTEAQVGLVEWYAKEQGLWFDPHVTPRYTKSIEVDLDAVGWHIAGPRRPQDLLDYGDSAAALRAVDFRPQTTGPLPAHAVALAAITSCTNTSDPALLIAAGLVARKARALGLRVPHWVKTSLAPGSPAAASYLARAGLLQDLEAIGFSIVGYGCTTCIGNSGPLTQPVRAAQQAGECRAVAILSGNRNFPGRVHPDIDLGFIMSPPMVVAFGLAGDAARNLREDPLQISKDGTPVYLSDLMPRREEVQTLVAQAVQAEDFDRDFRRASRNPLWLALQAPLSPLFPWDARSTTLRRPPFASLGQRSQLGRYTAYPLLVVGDDVTTDHISPASAIPSDSLVADFLVERGEGRDDLNVFASRRGNWEVMLRAAFHNRTLKNLLAPSAPVAHTLHTPSGQVQPIWEVARRYAEDGQSVVLVAGERYGTGSSRDWAAKGQRLLGIRAVLAVGFERIHRSNLIGMGILPLRLPQPLHLQPGDRIEIDAAVGCFGPRSALTVRIHHHWGASYALQVSAAVETRSEMELLEAGGVIPTILRQALAASAR